MCKQKEYEISLPVQLKTGTFSVRKNLPLEICRSEESNCVRSDWSHLLGGTSPMMQRTTSTAPHLICALRKIVHSSWRRVKACRIYFALHVFIDQCVRIDQVFMGIHMRTSSDWLAAAHPIHPMSNDPCFSSIHTFIFSSPIRHTADWYPIRASIRNARSRVSTKKSNKINTRRVERICIRDRHMHASSSDRLQGQSRQFFYSDGLASRWRKKYRHSLFSLVCRPEELKFVPTLAVRKPASVQPASVLIVAG